MENLTKQQIVLVTLLVSFVTSIATGIVTVALMDQAPPAVTRTINQVVEKTIEKVVQTPAQQASVVTKETVVVKEDDMVVAAVDKNSQSLVRISIPEQADGTPAQIVALGIILSPDGLIASDSTELSPDLAYSADTADGKTYPIISVLNDTKTGITLFKIKQSGSNPVTFQPASLADSQSLKLGQAIIILGGKERNAVQTGIISSLVTEQLATTTATSTEAVMTRVKAIETDISNKDAFDGDMILDLSADVVGARYSTGDGWIILPADPMIKLLAAYKQKNPDQNSQTAGSVQQTSSQGQ